MDQSYLHKSKRWRYWCWWRAGFSSLNVLIPTLVFKRRQLRVLLCSLFEWDSVIASCCHILIILNQIYYRNGCSLNRSPLGLLWSDSLGFWMLQVSFSYNLCYEVNSAVSLYLFLPLSSVFCLPSPFVTPQYKLHYAVLHLICTYCWSQECLLGILHEELFRCGWYRQYSWMIQTGFL